MSDFVEDAAREDSGDERQEEPAAAEDGSDGDDLPEDEAEASEGSGGSDDDSSEEGGDEEVGLQHALGRLGARRALPGAWGVAGGSLPATLISGGGEHHGRRRRPLPPLACTQCVAPPAAG